MQTIPAHPAPTARPRPHPAAHATPRHEPEHATPKPTPFNREEVETPTPRPTPAPQQTPAPTPTPAQTRPVAPVVIEKSGLEVEHGEEPPPAPEPRSGWWIFGRRENYTYLTRSVREEIDRARVKRSRWKFIVVHNSGSRQGNAKIFDYYHRHVRKMPNGLAYHFVIGCGHGSGDGQIEIGDRWRRQINGGHVHSDYLNNIALGICLVGDFNRTTPTQAQLAACEELIKYLRRRVGKVEGHVAIVKPHKAINPPRWPTDCPGDKFPYGWFRRF
jgi:hypothetical protein